jgi:thermolysin
MRNDRSLIVFVCLILVPFFLAADERRGFRAFSGHRAERFHIPDDMVLLSESIEKNDIIRERYQQYFDEAIPVLGAQITIRKEASHNSGNAKGRILTVIGAHYPDLVPQNTVLLTGEDAVAVVASEQERDGPYRTFLMLNPRDERFFYWIGEPRRASYWVFWVDAENGDVVDSYNTMAWSHDNKATVACEDLPSHGYGVNADCKNLTGLTSSNATSGYSMIDATESIIVFDAENGACTPPIPPCDAPAQDSNDIWDYSYYASPGQGAIVDAQFYANWSNEYYKEEHGFKFPNEYTNGIQLIVHFDNNRNGASWDEASHSILFGDGDRIKLKESSGALEVVGHEMAHAIIDKRVVNGTGTPEDPYIYGLEYEDESGAVDEGFADIMGTSIEYYYGTQLPAGQSFDWTIGEDIGLPVEDPYIHRSMENPTSVFDDEYFDCHHPAHYGDILRMKHGHSCPTNRPDCDDGFVHYNSGIINHWFYLLVNGGTNANPLCHRPGDPAVIGIGMAAIQDAAAIAYAALVDLNYTASICNARDATKAQADSLYGETYASKVEDAWHEVGVSEQLCDPPDLVIESPMEGETIGGPDEVTLQGYATDLGGIKTDVLLDTPLISLSIKRVDQAKYQPLLTSSFTYGIPRTDICIEDNDYDDANDTCIWDPDTVCLVDLDPNCPNVGWTASFDPLDYTGGDYIIRLGAEDYQNDTVEYLYRAITIDNSHVNIEDGIVPRFDTWVDQGNPSTNNCLDDRLYLEGDVDGEYMYTYLYFEVPPFPGGFHSSSLVVTTGKWVLKDLHVSGIAETPWQSCWPTWNSQPNGDETPIADSVAGGGDNEIIEIPVSSYVNGPGTYTLKLVDTGVYVQDRYIFSTNQSEYPKPTLVIRSDLRVLFTDGFESGDTSAWSTTVQ